MRAPAATRARRTRPRTVSVRLAGHAALEARPDGHIIVRLDGYSLDAGWFSAGAADRALALQKGQRLSSLESGGRTTGREIESLLRRLARHGLLEYPVGRSRDADTVVIEPQLADYWPQTPPLGNADLLVLSRFAYLRRRGDAMVLESPRAGALFRLGDPKIAAALAELSTPQQVGRLRRQEGFPGIELLALLVDCQILFKVTAARDGGLRPAEGDADLVLWDFHDLLFHARSTPGRHANPLGGTYSYSDVAPAPPAVRRRWPGKAIDLREHSLAPADVSPVARLLRERHSIRGYDDRQPITLAELARFLDDSARVVSTWQSPVDLGDVRPMFGYATRPYPSAGASYELELYLAVHRCEGLARGFYHYDAGGHALVPIEVGLPDLQALLSEAQSAMDAPATPQIVVTIAARFSRVSWKYSSLAYALILKDVGVLIQTLYLIATDMGLGGCAIGSSNIDLFAKMTGIEFHIEGPVGQFALGRGAPSETSG
ncbi:MAG: SagB family peptide dehydrogenase [Alphaproteobacteria bacterium]